MFRHGCLVGEGLRDPLFDRVPANNWGQAATITALITGIAQDQGLVDIDAPIGIYLPAEHSARPRLGDRYGATRRTR